MDSHATIVYLKIANAANNRNNQKITVGIGTTPKYSPGLAHTYTSSAAASATKYSSLTRGMVMPPFLTRKFLQGYHSYEHFTKIHYAISVSLS